MDFYGSYGVFEFPGKLEIIYGLGSHPRTFLLEGKPFVLEIQYLLDALDEGNYSKGMFSFAVDGNGNKLFIELQSGLFWIYLEESGVVEPIDANLDDIIIPNIV
jgi:hypothetical protein